MKVRRTRTLSSSRPSDISVVFGGGNRHGAKTIATLELVIKFSLHLTAVHTVKKSNIRSPELSCCFHLKHTTWGNTSFDRNTHFLDKKDFKSALCVCD